MSEGDTNPYFTITNADPSDETVLGSVGGESVAAKVIEYDVYANSGYLSSRPHSPSVDTMTGTVHTSIGPDRSSTRSNRSSLSSSPYRAQNDRKGSRSPSSGRFWQARLIDDLFERHDGLRPNINKRLRDGESLAQTASYLNTLLTEAQGKVEEASWGCYVRRDKNADLGRAHKHGKSHRATTKWNDDNKARATAWNAKIQGMIIQVGGSSASQQTAEEVGAEADVVEDPLDFDLCKDDGSCTCLSCVELERIMGL